MGERKFIKIGVNANVTAPKQKTYEGRAIIRGRSYTLARDAIIRAGIKRDSRYITTLTQESVVYVEKVFPKAHRAKITSPVRGWISTWTKNGRLLQFSIPSKFISKLIGEDGKVQYCA